MLSEDRRRKRGQKRPRNKGGRAATIVLRKEKRRNRDPKNNNIYKYILKTDHSVLKPQWKGLDGHELSVSNKKNLVIIDEFRD